MKVQDHYPAMRLADTGRLLQAGLMLPLLKQDSKSLRSFLGKLRRECARRIWLIVRKAADSIDAGNKDSVQEEIVGMFALQPIDNVSRRDRLLLFCLPTGPDEHLLLNLIDYTINKLDVYRLELEIGPDQRHWQPILLKCGWQNEGRACFAQYNERTSSHHDVERYRFLRPQQPFVQVAFIPFRMAVLALEASQTSLLRSCFVRYGQAADERIQETAEWLQLLDSQGCLPDRPTLLDRMGANSYLTTPNASELLHQAARRVVSYFNGEKKPFALTMHLEQGSPFQRQVWQALQDIPYGETRTYEEIALAIHPDNEEEARRMVRAVGAACGANPLPVLIPCHRVIGKDGKLVGFSSGLDLKEYLLAHEIMGIG